LKRDPNLVCLSREHHDGLVLCLRIERELPETQPPVLEALYRDVDDFWEQALLRHFRAESECLLARLVRYASYDDEMVSRLNTDHLRLAAIIAEMRDDPKTRPRCLEAFGKLLRDHIKWEEEQLFEITQQRLKKREMEALGRELEARLPPVCFPNLWAPAGPPNKKAAARRKTGR
jgi:hemerythrin-like domain-containing protein